MALRGRIEDFKLTEILKLIEHEKKSGVLLLEDGDNIGAILFNGGHVIFAFMGDGDIGQKLVNCREISPSTLKYLRKAEEEDGKGMIKTIIEQNFIAKKKLQEFLEMHTKEVLGDLLGWSEGEFDFGDQQEIIDDFSIGQQIHIREAIEEAHKKLDIWEEIKKVIPDSRAIISLSPDGANNKDEIVLSSVEWRVISEVNGERSVSEIAGNCGMDKLSVSKIIVELAKSRMATVCPYEPKSRKIVDLPKHEPVIDSKVVELVRERVAEELPPMKHAIGEITGHYNHKVQDTTNNNENNSQNIPEERQEKNINQQVNEEIKSNPAPNEVGTGVQNESNGKESTNVIEFNLQERGENKHLADVQEINKMAENFKGKKDIASMSFALEELQLLSSGNDVPTDHFDEINKKAIDEKEEEKEPRKDDSEGIMNKFFKRK